MPCPARRQARKGKSFLRGCPTLCKAKRVAHTLRLLQCVRSGNAVERQKRIILFVIKRVPHPLPRKGWGIHKRNNPTLAAPVVRSPCPPGFCPERLHLRAAGRKDGAPAQGSFNVPRLGFDLAGLVTGRISPASSAPRTLRARQSRVKGFWRKVLPLPRFPWPVMASSV